MMAISEEEEGSEVAEGACALPHLCAFPKKGCYRMMATETGESFGGRLTSEISASHAAAAKPERHTVRKEVVGYLVCGVTSLSVLVAIVFLIVYQTDVGVETHSLCITNECKIFARQVSIENQLGCG
ncbi:uncharacterized protein LOC144123776 [Amblyomma americanum]